MSIYEPRSLTSIVQRLRLILFLMIIWEALAVIAELSFGSFLFEISGDKISGILAGRGSFGGAAVMPMFIYIYALRAPLRYRGLLYLAMLENAAAILFCVFHLAVGNVEVQGAFLTMVVSAIFLVAFLLNLPRGKVA
jgi:hypothetical protein